METSSVLRILCVFLLGTSIEGLNHRREQPKRLFVIGDSDVDTGNIMKPLAASWLYPYGITFPGKPTGRFSDGRDLTDFIAEYLGIPSPVPYEARRFAGSKKRYGMNFAYGGTGAFDTHYNLPNFTVQISHLEQLVKDGTYSRRQLRSSMVLFSVGGNDYSEYVFKNGTAQGQKAYAEKVMNQVAVDLRRLISLGVGWIAVKELPAAGCVPVLTTFIFHASCIEPMNEAAAYHNSQLHKVVDGVNKALPHGSSRVVILPLYDAQKSILEGHHKLGENFDDPLKECCKGVNGGNCGSIDKNGNPLYIVCANPRRAYFWDGVHPTQAGWSATVQLFHPALRQLFS